MVPYWLGQSPSHAVFLKKTLSKSCNEYEVDGGMTFGHGVLDISRAHIVSLFIYGCLCEGCVASSFAMQHFSKPFICH